MFEVIEVQKLVKEKFQQTLDRYDKKKYFELQKELDYVKDFIIWKHSFLHYFKLFTNFKNGLIDGESFVNEFFDLFNEDKKLLEDNELLKNFIFNSESFKETKD